MVPVQGSIAAYGSGESGLLSKGLSAGYGFVSGGVGMVTGALGTFLGVAQVAPPSNASSRTSTPAGQNASGSINVRTLRDQQTPRDDHQLYNGNQLNFEPRKDQDDKKD
ncbi:MAG: hypothetical protein M1830_003933 [Pleopsidium flavum]|nr:MAG: hypothetical protein M1830_003933 [Pleopsidium flavum]